MEGKNAMMITTLLLGVPRGAFLFLKVIQKGGISLVHSYEQVLIFPPETLSEHIDEMLAKTREFIEKHGGTVISKDSWGRRRTAYPIDKHREGFYVVLQFTADPSIISEIDKSHRLNRRILRHLTVKRDVPVAQKQSVPES